MALMIMMIITKTIAVLTMMVRRVTQVQIDIDKVGGDDVNTTSVVTVMMCVQS